MPDRSFSVFVAPREGPSLFTGPMTLAALTLGAGALTRLSGLDHAGFVFCYFKALTGHACFTCGTTRALGHLSRLDVASAFAVQPLVTVGAVFLLLWGAIDAVLLLASKRTMVRLKGRALRAAAILGVALAVLNWIYLLAAGV